MKTLLSFGFLLFSLLAIGQTAYTGNLSKNQFDEVKELLNNVASLDTSKEMILIHYLTEREGNVIPQNWDVLNNDYEEKINAHFSVDSYFFHHPNRKKINEFHRTHLLWSADKNNIILDIFQIKSSTFNAFILIRPNGEFLVFNTEYNSVNVLKALTYFVKK